MHACLEAVNRLGNLDHLAGQLGEAATGSPGKVNKLGSETVHAVHTVVEVLHALRVSVVSSAPKPTPKGDYRAYLGSLGRKEFEGEGGLAIGSRLGELL